MVIVQVVKRPGTNVLLSSFMTIDPKETIVHLFEGKISALLRKAEKIAGDLTDVLVKLNKDRPIFSVESLDDVLVKYLNMDVMMLTFNVTGVDAAKGKTPSSRRTRPSQRRSRPTQRRRSSRPRRSYRSPRRP